MHNKSIDIQKLKDNKINTEKLMRKIGEIHYPKVLVNLLNEYRRKGPNFKLYNKIIKLGNVQQRVISLEGNYGCGAGQIIKQKLDKYKIDHKMKIIFDDENNRNCCRISTRYNDESKVLKKSIIKGYKYVILDYERKNTKLYYPKIVPLVNLGDAGCSETRIIEFITIIKCYDNKFSTTNLINALSRSENAPEITEMRIEGYDNKKEIVLVKVISDEAKIFNFINYLNN